MATLINVFSACNHSGEPERALGIWESRSFGDESIRFNRNVVTTLVDGLAKKGMLREAKRILEEYHASKKVGDSAPDNAMWMALLSGCRNAGDDALHDEIYNDMKKRFCLEKVESSS